MQKRCFTPRQFPSISALNHRSQNSWGEWLNLACPLLQFGGKTHDHDFVALETNFSASRRVELSKSFPNYSLSLALKMKVKFLITPYLSEEERISRKNKRKKAEKFVLAGRRGKLE